MPTLGYFVLTGLLFLLARLAAGRWHPGYFVGGLLFGVYNEFSFEFSWDYNPVLGPMLWRDIPLLVVIGWGVLTTLTLSISDRLSRWRGIGNPAMRAGIDVAVFALMGYLNEVTMSSSGVWTYNFPLHASPAIQILGYIGVGIMVSSVGRAIDSYLSEVAKPKEVTEAVGEITAAHEPH